MHPYEILLPVFLISAVGSSVAPTRLLLSRVGPCYDGSKTPISVQELSIMTKTYDSTLSGMLNITEDIPDGWSVKATMQKCQDIRNRETCDHLKSFYLVRDGCNQDKDDDREIYSLVFNYTVPRISCPLRSGCYKLIDYPVLTEDNHLAVYESKISTSVFGYTLRLDGFGVDGIKIMCVDAFLQLVYLRTHDWVEIAKNNTSQNQTEVTSIQED